MHECRRQKISVTDILPGILSGQAETVSVRVISGRRSAVTKAGQALAACCRWPERWPSVTCVVVLSSSAFSTESLPASRLPGLSIDAWLPIFPCACTAAHGHYHIPVQVMQSGCVPQAPASGGPRLSASPTGQEGKAATRPRLSPVWLQLVLRGV